MCRLLKARVNGSNQQKILGAAEFRCRSVSLLVLLVLLVLRIGIAQTL